MKYKILALLCAPMIFINGALFLLSPIFTLKLLGSPTDITGIMNTRLSGACALGLSIILWFSRNITDRNMIRLITYAMIVVFTSSILIDIDGIISGAINQLGWITLTADIFFLIGFVSSIFTGTGEKP